jgi:methyl-accepting chemotaxis protein
MLSQLGIRTRWSLGFGALCLLLAGVVMVTVIKVAAIDKATDRTVNLRMPTAMAANDLVASVYASLAALRGWLITGNESFKVERAQVWRHIQSDGAEMDKPRAALDE